MEAENRRRRENRERVKAKRRRNIESETVSSQGCCAPSVSSKDTRTDAEQNRWHGAEYIRIGTWSRFLSKSYSPLSMFTHKQYNTGEQRDRMRHQAVIADAAAAAASAICGMINLTPVENKMRSDIEHLNRVETELETVVDKNKSIKTQGEEKEDMKKTETKEFNFEKDVSSALRRAFRREK